jgi:chromosomal replication initiation ATPase DnaA
VHPELLKAMKTARLGKRVNGVAGIPTTEVADREIEHVSLIARLRIQVDSLEKTILILQQQLSQALTRWPMEKPPRLVAILEAASGEFRMEKKDILTKRRTAEQAVVRQIVCYLAHTMTDHNDTEIAAFVGRDRTSVVQGRTKIARLLLIHPELVARVENIKRSLVSHQTPASQDRP